MDENEKIALDVAQQFTYKYFDDPRHDDGRKVKIPFYNGKPLGGLKWGHPALIYHFGEHFRSPKAWDAWCKNGLKNNK